MSPGCYIRKITFPDGFVHVEEIHLPHNPWKNGVISRIMQLGYRHVNPDIKVEYARSNTHH